MKNFLATIAVIIVVCFAALVARIGFRLRELTPPAPIERSFAEWTDDWQLPPMQAAEYWITLYGHPAKPLRIEVVDQTTGQKVPIDGPHVGGMGPESMIVGEFEIEERHRYTVRLDQEQVRELASGHVEIAPTPAELNNRVGQAIFGGPRWSPSRRSTH